MTFETAINKAIDGGWNGFSGWGNRPYPNTPEQRDHLRNCFVSGDEEFKKIMGIFWRTEYSILSSGNRSEGRWDGEELDLTKILGSKNGLTRFVVPGAESG